MRGLGAGGGYVNYIAQAQAGFRNQSAAGIPQDGECVEPVRTG